MPQPCTCMQVYAQLELPFARLLAHLGRQPLALDPSALLRALPEAQQRYMAPVVHQAAAQSGRQAQAQAAAVVRSSAWLKLLQRLVRPLTALGPCCRMHALCWVPIEMPAWATSGHPNQHLSSGNCGTRNTRPQQASTAGRLQQRRHAAPQKGFFHN